jgi:hypothetical protein
MSTQPTPPAAPVPPPSAAPAAEQSVVIYSHSFLFYWWPVWLVGFILGFIVTPLSGQKLAVVPDDTELEKPELKDGKIIRDVNGMITITEEGKGDRTQQIKSQPVLIVPKGKDVSVPKLHISNSKNNGVIFFSIMLFVIFVTCVPLRGLLSIMVIMLIGFLVIIFALAGIWDKILTNLSFIDIRINQGGYLFFSTVLFIMWLLVFLFYDKQIYVMFKPGQVVVKLTIGEGELVFGTEGMVLQKLRSNFFLHWILGLGTSDLVIKFSGAAPQHFDLPNVFVGANRLAQIESLTKTRAVVSGRHA